MHNKKTLLILAAVFVLLLVGASVLYTQLGDRFAPDQLSVQTTGASQDTVPQLQQVPDFTVYDLAGNPVQLSDYFGKPIILNFWASWCGPCRSEMPHFEEKYLALKEDVAFLMVNMTDNSRETVEVASKFIADAGYTFPVLYDTASSAAITYGVYSLPTTYFINAEGYGIAKATGAINAANLQQGIDMIYQKEP